MGVTRVSPGEAHDLIEREGHVHVDVRTEAEWAAGHPRGALNVPFQIVGPGGLVMNQDFVRVMTELFGKAQALVLGCKSGARSLKAATLLVAHGFTRVVDQRAGIDGVRDAFGRVTEPGWARSGLPVEAGSGAGSYAELLGRLARRGASNIP